MSALERTSFGTLGNEIRRKLKNDNDAKVIIQGKNSQTGIGKTTLAILLCRYLDITDDEWTAEDKSFIDVQKYLNACLDYPKGTCLLLDEIEAGADSRRAMSGDNVNLSQGWAKLRARNIATVCTLPSISMLDKRMLELADYWVLVKKRGIAQPFRVNVNDFAPHRAPQRLPFDGDEHIKFADIPSNDPDKRYLDQIKDEHVRGEGTRSIPKPEHDEAVAKAKKKAKKAKRNEMIRSVYNATDLSYRDLGDAVGLSGPAVGKIVREETDDG